MDNNNDKAKNPENILSSQIGANSAAENPYLWEQIEKHATEEKAKKILFGRTDIGNTKESYDGALEIPEIERKPIGHEFYVYEPPVDTSDELKSEIQYTPITEDSYDGKKLSDLTIDEPLQFRKPPIDTSSDIQNEKGEEQGFDATKWIEEIHFRSPESWIKTVRDYCQQNNITPDRLIEQHRVAYKDV